MHGVDFAFHEKSYEQSHLDSVSYWFYL